MTWDERLGLQNFLTLNYNDLKQKLARRLGNPELAGDALQDTWLRLEGKLSRGQVKNPGAYLFRMACNVAIDHLRSESRRLSSDEIDAILDLADPAPGPAPTVQAQMELDALTRIMRELPERQCTILLLVRLERLPQREVAIRLGISLRLVELELQRAQEYCAARLDH
jgi:RNA polymerase sigma factor (sigma-70 family)